MKRLKAIICLLILLLINTPAARGQHPETQPEPRLGEAPAQLALPERPDRLPAISLAPPNGNHTYLPIIAKSGCSPNSQEAAIASLAANHPNQGRPVFKCHPILARVARERALDMGVRDYFNHTNPDGLGPNYLVRQAGYHLPDWWPKDANANFIESIAGGYSTAQAAWKAWLNSPGHRVHVLGEDPFWAEQTNYGIGYAFVENSTYRHYWVFITAPPE